MEDVFPFFLCHAIKNHSCFIESSEIFSSFITTVPFTCNTLLSVSARAPKPNVEHCGHNIDKPNDEHWLVRLRDVKVFTVGCCDQMSMNCLLVVICDSKGHCQLQVTWDVGHCCILVVVKKIDLFCVRQTNHNHLHLFIPWSVCDRVPELKLSRSFMRKCTLLWVMFTMHVLAEISSSAASWVFG